VVVTPTERPPAVAGTFYPADPGVLRATIDDALAAAEAPDGPPPKALIVPHAGYVYSGPVAASAYASLRPVVDVI
jgi:AmmeMemoRadiSam system protein B